MPHLLRNFIILALCWLTGGGCCCIRRVPCAGGLPHDCRESNAVPCCAAQCPSCAAQCPSCAAQCPTGGKLPGALFRWANGRMSCGSGCGEVYWNEWMIDPPDPCDPCDACGEWTGQRDCCEPRRPARNIVMGLFARRYRRDDCAPCQSAGAVLSSPDVAWDGLAMGSNLTPSCSRCGH